MTATREERCELTELIVSQCAHCRVTPDPFVSDLVITTRFPARYSGVCPACDGHICEDDLIGRTEDGEYVCTRCADRAVSS